jgi:NADPH-dependent curcumin reductase CurA
MTNAVGRKIVLAARPHGTVTPDDFRIEDFAPSDPKVGELPLEVKYLSLDPYMRSRMDDRKSYADPLQIGEVMRGESVSTVLASENSAYRAGDFVLAHTGWQTHAAMAGDSVRKINPQMAPVTTRLGVLGMPGFTAYAGMKAIGRPAKGETVVVAAASGPVGSLVGQLAQIAGARSVGIAGGSAKCAYLRDELHFDAAVDHRAKDFDKALAFACPSGIDVYFENVGGRIWHSILPLLNRFARVPVCGLVAEYDKENSDRAQDYLPATMRQILNQSVVIQGFLNYDLMERYYDDFIRDVSAWIAEGRVKYKEDIVDGLENAPQAFIGMLAGRNFGKLLVHVAR